MTDGYEIAQSLNPQTNDANGDQNGNGISNIDEFNNSPSGDPDGDGFTNAQEALMGTDPHVYDAMVKSEVSPGVPLTVVFGVSPTPFYNQPITLTSKAIEWKNQGLDVKKFVVFEEEATGPLAGWVVSTVAMLNGQRFVRYHGSPLTFNVTDKWNNAPGGGNTLSAFDEIGCYHYLSNFRVLTTTQEKVELAVDANRDGEIHFSSQDDSDKTTADNPFRFWVNDDDDHLEESDTIGGTPDSNDDVIATKRDLEDFQRLWMKIDGDVSLIKSGTLKVALKWKNVTGSPSIKIYKAVEQDGGKAYLEDNAKAGDQISGQYGTAIATVSGTSPVELPASLFTNLSDSATKVYFIFEGANAGKGDLVAILTKGSQTQPVSESEPVHISLKTATDMYSQAQALPQNGIDDPYEFFPEQPPADPLPSVAWQDATSSNFEKPTGETSQCVIFVHGWNVSNGRYEQQAVSMFKRLWLQGYKGRFVSMRWPSVVSSEGDANWWQTAQNAEHYYEIEYRGFKYAKALKQYAEYLASTSGGGFTVKAIGHSMGNIVTSEAVKIGGPISKYVLLDAAVSAGCYDTQDALLNASIGDPLTTPDFSAQGGYRGYFSSLSGLSSFYNVDDEALKQWSFGNLWKRDFVFVGGMKYLYDDGVKLSKPPPLPSAPPPDPRSVNHIHEAMTMFAVSRTKAAGAESRTAGAISSSFDLKGYFGSDNADHSATFDKPIQFNGVNGVKAAYQEILRELQISFTQ